MGLLISPQRKLHPVLFIIISRWCLITDSVSYYKLFNPHSKSGLLAKSETFSCLQWTNPTPE